MSTQPPARKAPTALDKPMTRRGCVIGVALWALVMALPVCLFALAMRGELGWQRGPFNEDRVWLIRADPNAEQAQSGLAYQNVRVVEGRTGNGTPVSVRTRVYFWLWEGESETVEFCESYQPDANGSYQATGACP
jgi:hypothetical protein